MKEISWARPLLRAERHVRDAGELLDRRQTSEGLDALAEAQREISRAVEFILEEESSKAYLSEKNATLLCQIDAEKRRLNTPAGDAS